MSSDDGGRQSRGSVCQISRDLHDIFYVLSSGESPLACLEKLKAADPELLRASDHDLHAVLRNVFDGSKIADGFDDCLKQAVANREISVEDLVFSSLQVIRFLEASIDRFEPVFLSALTRESQLGFSLDLRTGNHSVPVCTLLGVVREKDGFADAANVMFVLAKAYLQSRPVGFFKDIQLSSRHADELQVLIGHRLLEENRGNNRVMRQVVERDFSL